MARAAERTAYLARALDGVRTQRQAIAAAAAAFEVTSEAGELGTIVRPALSAELNGLRSGSLEAPAGAGWARTRRHIERIDGALADDRGWGVWFDLAEAIRDAAPEGAAPAPTSRGLAPSSRKPPAALLLVALVVVVAFALR